MENETIDAPEVIETQESVEETVETPIEEENVSEKIFRLEKEKQEIEEKNKKLYARLKEQEKERESIQEFGTKDILSLAEAGVSSHDYDWVVKNSKILGKTVFETLQDPDIQRTMKTRSEERKTNEAMQAKGGARGTAKISGEELLRTAERTGEIPTSEEGMRALFLARQARKTKSN